MHVESGVARRAGAAPEAGETAPRGGLWHGRPAVLLAAALLILLLGGRGFWDPDEPRFAQVAREMFVSGDWLLPRFNGRPLALLPPLTYWSSAAVSGVAGDVTEWTARFPVLLFALLALAATMWIPETGGAWAGLVLLSSAKFLHQAQYLQADMLLVGAQTWALAAFYRAYAGTSRRGPWLLSAYLALALGVLAKGPLGILLPAAVLGLFLLWERDLGAVRRLGLGWGIPVVAAMVVPWYAAACARGGDAFCRELLIRHNVGMYFDTWSHARPVYYYLLHLPWMFLPWTLLLPSAIRRLPPNRETRFLVTWTLFTFLFFSLSDAKQVKYLLPILPPLSVIVGRWLGTLATPAPLRTAGLALALALAAAAIAAVLALPGRFPGTAFGAATTAGTGALLYGLAGVLAGRRTLACGLLVAGLPLAAVVGRLGLVPALDAYKVPRRLTEAARQSGDPVAIYGISHRQTGGLVYYTGRLLPTLDSPEGFEAWMGAAEPRLAFVPTKVRLSDPVVLLESPYREGTRLVSNRKREDGG